MAFVSISSMTTVLFSSRPLYRRCASGDNSSDDMLKARREITRGRDKKQTIEEAATNTSSLPERVRGRALPQVPVANHAVSAFRSKLAIMRSERWGSQVKADRLKRTACNGLLPAVIAKASLQQSMARIE